MNDRTPDHHYAGFIHFAREELASGGPDPQVELTATATREMSESEAALFIGCFVGPYTCGSAGPLYRARKASLDLTGFVSTNWDGLPRRRERRVIDKRSGEKLAACLESWEAWTLNTLPKIAREPYPTLYKSVRDEVRFFGRYAAMKSLEGLKCAGLIERGQDSICAAGAKYPRKTLAAIFPDDAELLTSSSDAPATIERVDYLAAFLKEQVGLIETYFDFETLLCNYRQALAGKYPGRSHDRELAHFVKARAYWGDQILEWFPFFDLRAELFPHQYLGELGSPPWWGARAELEVPLEVPGWAG